MDSRNPAFNPATLTKLRASGALAGSQLMTMNGTINKIGVLVSITLFSSLFSWFLAESGLGQTLALGGLAATLGLTLVLIFNKHLAPTLAPAYAVAEGFILGFIAYHANSASQGIALHSFIATFAILFAMIGLYHARILRATGTFKRAMIVALFAITFVYLADLVMMLFSTPLPMIHQASPMGIAFSCVAIGIASLSFILDFDMIERAVEAQAPKYMEWYAGFSVLLTIVWLYLEILRLATKLRK